MLGKCYMRQNTWKKLAGIPVETGCETGKQNGYDTTEAIHLALKNKLRLPYTLQLTVGVH